MINVALVGCGYWGPNLLRSFDRLANARPLVICDIRPERLEHLHAIYPSVTTTTDASAVAADPRIDAVAIATPVPFHFPIAEQMLRAGKHILVEKPLTTSSDDCTTLIDLANARNLTLMVGDTFLYSPAVLRMKEIIQSGEIGEVLYVSSRRLNLGLFRKETNVLWDLAPHDISILLFLKGVVPIRANCQGRAQYLEGVEDFTTTCMSFEDGTFATVQSSWLDPNKVRETTIVGSKKMICYDDTETREKIRIYDKGVDVPKEYDTFAEFHQAYHYGDMLVPHLNHDEPLRAECEHFIKCVHDGSVPRTDGEHARRVVRVLEAAYASLRNDGAWVQIASELGVPALIC